jgi:hypothetical protein
MLAGTGGEAGLGGAVETWAASLIDPDYAK